MVQGEISVVVKSSRKRWGPHYCVTKPPLTVQTWCAVFFCVCGSKKLLLSRISFKFVLVNWSNMLIFGFSRVACEDFLPACQIWIWLCTPAKPDTFGCCWPQFHLQLSLFNVLCTTISTVLFSIQLDLYFYPCSMLRGLGISPTYESAQSTEESEANTHST